MAERKSKLEETQPHKPWDVRKLAQMGHLAKRSQCVPVAQPNGEPLGNPHKVYEIQYHIPQFEVGKFVGRNVNAKDGEPATIAHPIDREGLTPHSFDSKTRTYTRHYAERHGITK